MITDKDVKKHLGEVRSVSQYKAARAFISICVLLGMIGGGLAGALMVRTNLPLGAAVIAISIIAGVITKQTSVLLIDIADSLHYEAAYRKFIEYMNARRSS